MEAYILQTKQLTKIYRSNGSEVHALRGVDLAVKPGELVAVMGPERQRKIHPAAPPGRPGQPNHAARSISTGSASTR